MDSSNDSYTLTISDEAKLVTTPSDGYIGAYSSYSCGISSKGTLSKSTYNSSATTKPVISSYPAYSFDSMTNPSTTPSIFLVYYNFSSMVNLKTWTVIDPFKSVLKDYLEQVISSDYPGTISFTMVVNCTEYYSYHSDFEEYTCNLSFPNPSKYVTNNSGRTTIKLAFSWSNGIVDDIKITSTNSNYKYMHHCSIDMDKYNSSTTQGYMKLFISSISSIALS